MIKNTRTLVISDIHGCYREFVELLQTIEYNSNKDRLILLGDYVSRGPCSKETVSFVKNLVEEKGVIAIQGNHDYRFVKVMESTATEKELNRFFDKGGSETLKSYCRVDKIISQYLDQYRLFIMREFSSHIHFLRRLPYFMEDDKFIFVHAGLRPLHGKPQEQNVHDLLYIKEEFYQHKTHLNKIVVFGHTPTKNLHGSADIWHGGDKIGIDGGCVFGGQLNCLELMNGEISNTYKIKCGN